MSRADERIGFIGLGNMGAPMAANLAARGFGLVCYDAAGNGRAPEGADTRDSSAAVAAAVEIVITSLPDGPATRQVLEAILAAPERRARIVIDTSTIGIDWARDNATLAEAAGVVYVDAPVSGGVAGARAATIAAMCAAPPEVVDALRPLLEGFAGNVFHVGVAAGQGQAMKLLNNFLSGTAMAATSEAVAFGAHQGLDMAVMLDVLNASSGQNTATLDKFPNRVLTGSYDAGFRTQQLVKDLTLYEAAAGAAGTARPVSPAVLDVWRRAAARGDGDFSEIYRFVRDSPD